MPTANKRVAELAALFGPWFIERSAAAALRASLAAGPTGEREACGACGSAAAADDKRPYELVSGVGVISLAGVMTKYRPWWGGAGTVEVRRALRTASEDPLVRSIMLVLDTPGGQVYGTADLADDVVSIDKTKKPVFAFCSDQTCSAGYWVASQARRVYANRTAMVGCIGTYLVLMDTSKWDAEMGLDFVLVSSGGVKGLGADGKVTPELTADVQREIHELNDQFLASVQRGRKFTKEQLDAVSDGRTHVGEKAKDLGLVDQIATLDVAMQAVISETQTMTEQEFLAYAKDHPEATKSFRDAGFAAGKEEGKKEGAAEATAAERKRIADLKAMKGAGADFVLEQAIAGKTPADAAIALSEKLAADLAAAQQKLTEAQNAKTTLDPGAAGRDPINTPGDAAGNPTTPPAGAAVPGASTQAAPQMSEERRKQLLGATSLGQAALTPATA